MSGLNLALLNRSLLFRIIFSASTFSEMLNMRSQQGRRGARGMRSQLAASCRLNRRRFESNQTVQDQDKWKSKKRSTTMHNWTLRHADESTFINRKREREGGGDRKKRKYYWLWKCTNILERKIIEAIVFALSEKWRPFPLSMQFIFL